MCAARSPSQSDHRVTQVTETSNHANTNDEMELDDQGGAESATPQGPPTKGTKNGASDTHPVPQENTTPVTPNPKDGAPAASVRGAG